MNIAMHYGIDVGGTKTEFAVFDQSFARIHSHRIPTPKDNYSKFLESVYKQIRSADEIHGNRCSVGLGLVGLIDKCGVSYSVNVPCLNRHTVSEDLSQMIGRRVSCINDVRAFALSEARGGAADEYGTMVGVVLGTGSSSGFCRNGVPCVGANGIAGEWGHTAISATVLDRNGLSLFDCACGKKGCIEMYASGRGLANLATHFMNETVGAAECVTRMRAGDWVARKVFHVWIDCVADIFSQIIVHSNPDAIVVGGGMSNVDELYDLLPGAVEAMLPQEAGPPPIRRAMFGDDSGVRGAAIVGAER